MFGSSGGSSGIYGGSSGGSSGAIYGGSSGGSSGAIYGGSSGGSSGAIYGGSSGGSGGVIYGAPALAPAPAPVIVGPPVTAVPASRAYLSLNVPADATVYMLDQRTTMEGTVRNFVTPKLEDEKVYAINVRVEWQQNGQKFVALGTQKIRSGDHVELEAKLDQAGTSLVLAQKGGQQGVLEFTAENAPKSAPDTLANAIR